MSQYSVRYLAIRSTIICFIIFCPFLRLVPIGYIYPFYIETSIILLLISCLSFDIYCNTLDKLLYSDFIFFIFIVISLLQSIYFEYNNYYIISYLIILYLFLLNLRNTAIYTSYVETSIVIITLLISVHLISQKYDILEKTNFNYKTEGIFNNPSVTANYLCICLPVVNEYNTLKKRLLVFLKNFTICFIIFSVIISHDLNSISVIIVLIILKTRSLLYRNKIIIFFLILLVLSIFFFIIDIPDFVRGRLLIQKISWSIFIDNTLFGIGLTNFKQHYNYQQAAFFREKLAKHFVLTHDDYLADNTYWAFNDYYEFLLENGILGTSIIICFMIFVALEIKNINNFNGYFFSILAFMLLAMSDYTFHNICNWIIVVYSLSILQKSVQPISIIKNIKLYIVNLFIFIYASFNLFHHINWIIAFNHNNHRLNNFKFSYSWMRYNGAFLYSYGLYLFKNHHYQEAKNILLESKRMLPNTDIHILLGDLYFQNFQDYKKASYYYKTASYIVPARITPHYKLFLMNLTAGNIKAAKDQCLIVCHMKIKVRNKNAEMMKYEMGDFVRKNGDFIQKSAER